MLKFGVFLLVCVAVATAITVEEKLVATIFKDYNKGVNPPTTPLEFGLSYLCADVNKANLQLTSRLLEKYTWQDSRLKWNPADYDNLTIIRYPASQLWKPDMKLYNSQHEEETRDEVNAVINSNGTILWIPIATYKTHCLPLRRNAFSCEIKLGPWTYSSKTIGLNLAGKGLDTFMYLDTCAYEIAEPQIKAENITYPCCPDEQYTSIDARFVVHDRV